MEINEPKVHIAFRFHTNFYHSYRGDTPDEQGFGIDIRVIRNTIDALDRWNRAGVPVKGTWDMDNAFSLGDIMPEYCQDIIEALQQRVNTGIDEINVMVYNNGLISAHTAVEFDSAISRALHNPESSGLCDVFSAVAPIVRPQEMMYTPLHLKLYPSHGVKAVSLFYSGVPFNAFSNFIQPLPLAHRYNPMWLSYPGIEEKMPLVPAYNHGDIADWLSLRRWVKWLHKKQLNMDTQQDFLLLIDADADDEFWVGYNVPVIKHLVAIADGLDGLIRSVHDLPFVVFTTPYKYLEEHPPLTTVQFGQDTADGSFDGYASWADKWSNHMLWTGIERARILELQALRLESEFSGESGSSQFNEYLVSSRNARLQALSTTHFGLSAPILNRERLNTAANLVTQAVRNAKQAFAISHNRILANTVSDTGFALYDYVRGVSTALVAYKAKASRALVRLMVKLPQSEGYTESTPVAVKDNEGILQSACIRKSTQEKTELIFIANLDKLSSKHYTIVPPGFDTKSLPKAAPVKVSHESLSNEWLTLLFNDKKSLFSVNYLGRKFSGGTFIRSAVNYRGHIEQARDWQVVEATRLGGGFAGLLHVKSKIPIHAHSRPSVHVEHTFLLTAELPYLYLTTKIIYPFTESSNFIHKTAQMLGSRYDNHWREVMPCEIQPALYGTDHQHLRVWKHNYLGHVSHYDLNYGNFSKNHNIDSFNNHITNGWVAVSDQKHGLLVAQTADAVSNFAFCPMRLRHLKGLTRILLNPFGTYFGKQWHYPTAKTGIGKTLAGIMASTLGPQAASYNGHSEIIRLFIAPYMGDKPADDLCADAEAFAYPYAVVSDLDYFCTPPHRSWQMESS